jgi:hypothetical protein
VSARTSRLLLLGIPFGIEAVTLAFCLAAPGLLRPVWPAYAIEAGLLGPIVLALLLLVRHQWSLEIAVCALAGQSLLILLLFAQIYSAIGLCGDAGSPTSFADGLYFSIVTWTTLGYGDFKPPASLHLFAAFEALYGYVFLGLIVGLIGSFFRD